MNTRPQLLFVVTEDWYFVFHRLPLAVAAQKVGFDVAVRGTSTPHPFGKSGRSIFRSNATGSILCGIS